ncbi:MAG: DUF2190 family protein [Rhodospirillaceae bacterium]
MKNYVQDGALLTVTAPATVTSGSGVIVGSIFGVAVTSASSGAAVTIQTEGVFDLAKKTTAVFAAGDKVSFDNTNGWADVPGTGFYPIGAATEAAGNGATVVRVKLNEIATAAA